MTRVKLSKTLKRDITADWQAAFPSLGTYRPMHLANRVGPLLVGLLLEGHAGNDGYTPTFHVHNLSRESPILTLGMHRRTPTTTVPYSQHLTFFNSLVEELRGVVLLRIEGPLRLVHIIQAYRSYFADVRSHHPGPYVMDITDMVLISGWGGNALIRQHTIEFVRTYAAGWPKALLEELGGLESWIGNLMESASDPIALAKTVEQQLVTHGLEKIPCRELIVG